jgi:uncharacterized membrane protein
MKKSFITGLMIFLPIALTLAIVIFIVNFFTRPFVDIVRGILEQYGLVKKGFLFFTSYQIQQYFSRFVILVLLFFFTVFLGIFARWFVVHYLVRFSDFVFHRIPIIRSIYITSKEVIRNIFATTEKSFKQAVLVPFPKNGSYSVGLITRENIQYPDSTKKGHHVAVFVPTTPNPTSGFVMLFRKTDVHYLDITIEDALKYIISCGVTPIPLQVFYPQSKKRKLS